MSNSVENFLERIENNSNRVEEIRNQLFRVKDISVPAPIIEGAESVDNPKTKLVYTDTGKYLGTAGHIYESIQPEKFLDSIVKTIIESDIDLDLDKLTYKTINDCKIIEFRLPVKTMGFTNARGKDDGSKLFLNFWTGFGGTSRTEIGLYSHRFICSNGMRIIKSETDLKVKHTSRMNEKALAFTQELVKTVAKVENTTKIWNEMNNKQVDSATTEAFARKMAKVKADEKISDLSTRKKNILNMVNEAIATEFQRTGANVWGLLNGATYYTNHLASGSENPDYVLTKSGAKMNYEAQKLCLDLIK